jgi:hypothetical protein
VHRYWKTSRVRHRTRQHETSLQSGLFPHIGFSSLASRAFIFPEKKERKERGKEEEKKEKKKEEKEEGKERELNIIQAFVAPPTSFCGVSL